jgi:hypothetical protein
MKNSITPILCFIIFLPACGKIPPHPKRERMVVRQLSETKSYYQCNSTLLLNRVILKKKYRGNGHQSNYSKPLIFPATRFSTCGPYTVRVECSYSRKKLKMPIQSKNFIIDLGASGRLTLNSSGHFQLFREEERRIAERAHFKTTFKERIFDFPENKKVRMVLVWNGKYMSLKINNRKIGKIHIIGTKVLHALRIGNIPLTIHKVTLTSP